MPELQEYGDAIRHVAMLAWADSMEVWKHLVLCCVKFEFLHEDACRHSALLCVSSLPSLAQRTLFS